MLDRACPVIRLLDSGASSSVSTLPTAGAIQPGQFNPNTIMFPQYGAPPVITQASPTVVNPFYGLGLPSGHCPQQLMFPQATSHGPQLPYMHLPGLNYQYLRPYEDVQPPIYSPINWSPPFPYPISPPAFGASRGLPGSSYRCRSPSPSEDPAEYPELRHWLNGVDRDHLRSRWGHDFSQFSARLELGGFTSLLHLEQITPNLLVGMTGMEDIAAERLLRFVREDIGELWAIKSPRPKRTRYSY